MPELPEMEIIARRLHSALVGKRVQSVVAPGINVLKTYDPPLGALEGAVVNGVTRRGKLVLMEVDSESHGSLVLMAHLMSAGRLQLSEKPGSLRDRAVRVLIGFDDVELQLREFGKKQAAWIKLMTADALLSDSTVVGLGPEALPPPADLARLLSVSRPLHALLRDQHVIAGIGRTWVDEILHHAQLSPFKRGADLDPDEVHRLSEAIAVELERGLDEYESSVAPSLPVKFPKPTRIHGHQGEPCYRCGTTVEAVFYEEYVLSYCPSCQTEGRVLKDRRLSRLLK